MHPDPSNRRFTRFSKKIMCSRAARESSRWIQSSIQRRGPSTLVRSGDSISTTPYLLIEILLLLETYSGNFSVYTDKRKHFQNRRKTTPNPQ